MAGRIREGLKSALLWRYRRGSWQYDVIVALILAFIFLSPKAFFNDRPSSGVIHEVDAPEEGARLFWIEPDLLEGESIDTSTERLQDLLRDRSGELLDIVRTETAVDESGNIRAYLVYARH